MSNKDLKISNTPNTPNKSKTSLEKDFSIHKIKNSIGLFLIFIAILLTLYYILNMIYRLSFSFNRIGDNFEQSLLHKLHLIRDDYGFKENDYIDFLFNIRTDDGKADCKINGRATNEGLEYVDVKGSSNICQRLIY